jgi:hypothetical protein
MPTVVNFNRGRITNFTDLATPIVVPAGTTTLLIRLGIFVPKATKFQGHD